ncbi:unnamed protein product [Darwinula stevensoni]|uniref:G-protein coupled receptors family 3 profile domain-containing protein n=1 Tax=Darwinula stevensoni TaxID=69355 RepID=A0A7R9A4H2_9CRUS|nr:unnamed protein product [Darwinula stevensoni]CAG0892546.1 unnamed protein product [Darwinula stevensoni]
MAFIIKAIYAMAHGLHDMQRHLCKGKGDGLCQEMFPFNGSLYKNFLLNVSFTYGEGDEKEQVTFDAKGDPPGRYDIMNYRYLENRTHDYVQIGTWDDGNLTLNATLIDPSAGQVKSVCSTPCPLGQRKNYQIGGQEKRCCWSCVKCLEYQFLSNEETCQDCPQGFWPNPNLTDCEPIEQETIEWGNRPAIVALILSGNGFLATLFTLVVFVAHNNTPVVKSSTRELTYIIFLGMCLCYATTFPMLAKPSQISCTLSRILPGLSFALIYAALLTKTNRIARILAGSKKKIITRKPRFMSGPAQVLITLILIGVEVGIVVTMLVLEPPKDEPHYPSKDRVILVCNTTTWGMMAPLCFDFFLLGLSTIYAMKTRNVPENYNEAKFIGFSVYTTVVIWIAFIPIYFNSDHLTATITLCYCMSLSGLVTLVLLFFPRLYIILCRPERNNRSEFITATTVRCHIGNSSGYSRTSTSLSVCEATER